MDFGLVDFQLFNGDSKEGLLGAVRRLRAPNKYAANGQFVI